MATIELGLLLIRLAIGLTMAVHGAQKLLGWFGGHGISGTSTMFETLGLKPGRTHAEIAGASELVGGLLVALGLFTPFGCAAIIAVMITAVATVHLPKGFFVANGGYEYNVVMGVVAAGVAFIGPGPMSFDWAAGIHWPAWLSWLCVLGGIAAAGVTLALRQRAQHEPGRPSLTAP